MSQGIELFVYPVKDIEQAKALYRTLLGTDPYVDGAYQVSDIEKSLQSLLDAGAQVQQAVKNVGGGRLTAWVKDADGNITGLMQDTSPREN